MAREVTVRLSAEVQAFLTAMDQAERATTRVADAADRLSSISISADSSVASDLDQAASAADNAASSMEGASGAAEGMAGGLDSAAGAAQQAAGGIESAGASAETAGGGLESASASAQVFSSNMDGSGASAQTFAASLDTVGAQSQAVAGDMSSASAAMQAHAAITQQASAGMDSLSASFASGLSYTSGFGGSLRDAGGHLSSYGSTMSGVVAENRAFGAGLAVVGGGLSAMLGSVIQTGIAYNTLQQVSARAMETMTGSAEAAADQMERLHAFADESPFARDTWITAQQQLMAFGMEAERVVPTLEGVQNAVAAIGGGDAEIMQLVDILGQVEGQGRITGRELQRLGQMGINAADLIGDAMGVSGNEIRTQITAGALDAETAIDALTTGMMTRFDGAAEGLRDTMEGSLDRIRARIRDIGSVLAEPLVSADGGGFLVEAINQAADFGSALLELPPVALQVVGGIGVLTASVLTLGGLWGLAGSQIASFGSGAMQAGRATIDLGRNLVTTAGGLRRLAAGAGIAVAAIAGLMILDAISENSADFAASVERMTQELVKAADGAAAFESIQWTRATEGKDHVDSLTGAFERLNADGVQGFNDSMNRFFESFLPIGTAITDLDQNIQNLGESVSSAFDAGNFDQAAAGMRELAAASEEAGWSAEQLLELFPDYRDELMTLAQEAGHSASAQDILAVATNEAALAALQNGESWSTVSRLIEQGADAAYDAEGAMDSSASAADRARDAYSRMGEAASAAADGISGLVDDMNALADINRSAQQVEMDWIASIQEMNAALDSGSTSLNRYTEEGRANREMLLRIAGDTMEAAASTATLGGSMEDVQSTISQGVGAVREFGEAAGLSSSEVDDLIRQMYGIPPEVPIDMWVEDRATDVFNEVESQMDGMPDELEIWLEGEDRNVQDLINSFVEGDYESVVDILGDSAYAEEALQALQDGDYRLVAEIMAEKEQAEAAVNALVEGDYFTWVDIIGNAEDADAAIAAIQQGDYEALVQIIGDETRALEIWNGTMEYFDGAPPAIIDMDGDPSSAESDLNSIVNGDHLAIIQLMGDDSPARNVIDALLAGDYQTVADILGDDTLARNVMDAFLAGDYQTVADLLANDSAARQTVGAFTSTQWQTFIQAIAQTGAAQAALNALTRTRTAYVNVVQRSVGSILDTARSIRPFSSGGLASLPGYSTGGQLPYTGLGTDMMLGITGTGMPIARVDDGEFITRRTSTEKYLPLLHAINQDDPYGIKRYAAQLSGYANGGRAGYQGQVREFSGNGAAPVVIRDTGGRGSTGRGDINVRIGQVNNPRGVPTEQSVKYALEYPAALGGGSFE